MSEGRKPPAKQRALRETQQSLADIEADASVERELAQDELNLLHAIEDIAIVLRKADNCEFAIANSLARKIEGQLRDLADHVDDLWPEEEK